MNKQLRMKNTEFYEYTNVNPKDKFGGDCVIRAIADALDQSWETTVRELTELGIKKGFLCNDNHLYPKYLESKGFRAMSEPRDVNNRKLSVKDFLIQREGYPMRTIVANVGSHHVTCIKGGKVHDIWNSSNETMHKYWVKIF